MDQKKLGIGFIGAGEISILHGRAIRQIPNAYLVGLWNRTESTAKRRGKEEGCKVYKTPEELVSDSDIGAVIICTNLETHLPFARLAMEAGKHVLVEKPICSSVAEVEEMKAVAEQTGRLCVPGHNMIHEESLRRARRLIVNGDIGQMVVYFKAPHMIVGCHLIGNPARVAEELALLRLLEQRVASHLYFEWPLPLTIV